MSDRWADTGAALLAARGLGDLPPADAQALLALLHVGTLVETDDVAVLRALDLERLGRWRALAIGTPTGAAAVRAAIGLLALGHREPARALLARERDPLLRGAWAAWVGEGDAGEAPLELDGLRLAPAAHRGELALDVGEAGPARFAVRRLRVGGTALDVELRRRPSGLVLRLARMHGPALGAVVDLPARVALVTVDEVEGLATPLRFEVRERHEVVAYG